MLVKTGVTRFSVSTPSGLLHEFDETIKRMKYDRSKAIQIAMRNFLSDHIWAKGEGVGTGAIVILYDHKIRGLDTELINIQHHYQFIVTSSLHIHLDTGSCLEVIAVKGDVQEIRSLSKRLMGKRGVKEVRLAFTEQWE